MYIHICIYVYIYIYIYIYIVEILVDYIVVVTKTIVKIPPKFHYRSLTVYYHDHASNVYNIFDLFKCSTNGSSKTILKCRSKHHKILKTSFLKRRFVFI